MHLVLEEMPRKSGRLQGTTKPAPEEQSLSSLPRHTLKPKQICSSEHKGTCLPTPWFLHTAISHPSWPAQTPLIGSPHYPSLAYSVSPENGPHPKVVTPQPRVLFSGSYPLSLSRRGKLGFCPPWKMPGTIHYALFSKGETVANMSCQCPESSPSLWLSHSWHLSLCSSFMNHSLDDF